MEVRRLTELRTPQLYANAQTEYLQKYGPKGAKKDDFAQITAVNRSHGVRNPYSQLSKAVTAADVLASPTVSGDITRLQCCPSSVRDLPLCTREIWLTCATK